MKLVDYINAQEDGYTDEQIAEAAGMTLKELHDWKIQQGFEVPQSPAEERLPKEDYLAHKDDGWLDGDIAKKYGMARTTISNLKARWGIRPGNRESTRIKRGNPLTEKEKKATLTREKYLSGKAYGKTDAAIAREYKIRPKSLHEKKKKWMAEEPLADEKRRYAVKSERAHV
ncbi:hypothetical protein [Salibacterium lacus]|uniref:Uncharacterized protein n=1 Tax=Salibacterium lacus TaxID=1898109 RepID=A0ABW5SWQ6_9BACI